jgi:hypothetical protein
VLHSQPILGTDIKDLQAFAQLMGLQATIQEPMKIDDIKEHIISGIAPILVIQAWREDEIEYPFDWKDSHYIVACGYYDNGIYAMDPNVLGNYAYLPYSELMKRWHYADKSGGRHLQCGLVLHYENCPTPYNPTAVKYLG